MFIFNRTVLLLLVAVENMGVTSIARTMPRIRGHFLSAAFACCGRHHVSNSKCNGQLPLRIDSAQKKHRIQQLAHTYRSRSTHLFMSDDPNDGGAIINISQMKKTITRLSLRTVKKIGKASVRLKTTQDQLFKSRAAIEEKQEVDDVLLEQLEQSPSDTTLSEYENDLSQLQSRLQKLNWLEEQFNTPPLKKKGDLSPEQLLKSTDVGEQILQYIQELEINENEAAKQKRVEEDAKNKRSKKEMSYQKQQQQVEGSRLPYRRYYTEDNVEIKVRFDLTGSKHLRASQSYISLLATKNYHRSVNKRLTMMSCLYHQNTAQDLIGGITPPAAPAHMSYYAPMTPPHPRKTLKMLPP